MKQSAATNLNLKKQTDYDHDVNSEITLRADDIEELDLLGLTLKWKTIEKQLSNLCSDMQKGLDTQISVSPAIEVSVKAFHSTEWYDKNDPNVEN